MVDKILDKVTCVLYSSPDGPEMQPASSDKFSSQYRQSRGLPWVLELKGLPTRTLFTYGVGGGVFRLSDPGWFDHSNDQRWAREALNFLNTQ